MPFKIDTGFPSKHKVYRKNVDLTSELVTPEDKQARVVFMNDGTIVQYDARTKYMLSSGMRSAGPNTHDHAEVLEEQVPDTLRTTSELYRIAFGSGHILPCNLIIW